MEFGQGLRYCGRRILEHEVPDAEDVVPDVRVPNHLRDVHRERGPVCRASVLVQFLDVLADKVPLVQGEELAGTRGHLKTSVDFQHPVREQQKKKTFR